MSDYDLKSVDYVRREAVRSILERLRDKTENDDMAFALNWARESVDRIPAADVVPVVLCKDCKWTKTDGMEDPAIYCGKLDRWEMPPDGFCWLGKKRDGGGDDGDG